MSATKEFAFNYIHKEIESMPVLRGSFVIELTQAQFEDYQLLKQSVHTRLAELGLQETRNTYWYEAPPAVEAETIEKLRTAIKASDEAQFAAYYPHGFHHQHYNHIKVDGIAYRWKSFSCDQFIKFAPALVE